jgi:tetratricopeptide (TPR) repeat protein
MGTGPQFNSGVHNAGAYHSGYAHSGVYHQAYIGNHPVNMAYAGYHPSYMNHSFYHGPWSGHSYGWGWGWGPGFGLGLGLGYGLGSGWGYGGYGYGGYGPYGYWGRPLGWGFGGWGLGTLAYNSGYNPYYNPYYGAYANSPTIVYNYAYPIPVATQPDPGSTVAVDTPAEDPDQPLPQADNPDFDAARDAFQQGNYDAALASVDAAITKVPSDAVLHEFRALVLFAMQDFKQAAAVVHSVLAVGPGWDWTTMSSQYPDPNVYTQQLRALEDYTLANPRVPESHFLLAYHYMICNHNDAAANQLQIVTRLMPSDRLAGELLKMVQGPPKQSPSTQPPGPGNSAPGNPAPGDLGPDTPGPGPDASTASTDTPQPPAIDKDLLPGTWSASREDGSKFRLTMSDDGNFTWKYAPAKQKGEEFGGTYTIDGPVLVLERKEGGALAGTATFDGNGKFNFKMVGGPPEDKGLDFNK